MKRRIIEILLNDFEYYKFNANNANSYKSNKSFKARTNILLHSIENNIKFKN